MAFPAFCKSSLPYYSCISCFLSKHMIFRKCRYNVSILDFQLQSYKTRSASIFLIQKLPNPKKQQNQYPPGFPSRSRNYRPTKFQTSEKFHVENGRGSFGSFQTAVVSSQNWERHGRIVPLWFRWLFLCRWRASGSLIP